MRVRTGVGVSESGSGSGTGSGSGGVRARARAPNKGFARRPQEFLGWEEWVRRARGVRRNKGFARRPLEFLGWEEWEWEWMLERGINKDVRALWQVCMRIIFRNREVPYGNLRIAPCLPTINVFLDNIFVVVFGVHVPPRGVRPRGDARR